MNAPKTVNIWSDKFGGNISTNEVHQAILVDGKVFDNLTPEELDYQIWKNDIFCSIGAMINKTPL
jgi:Papain fold toxin 2